MTTLGWTSILVLAGGAYAFKVLGLLLGSRVARRALGIVALLPAALLPALVVANTFAAAAGDGRALVVDARAAGMAVALVAAWRRAPFVVIVVLAAAVTALVRAIS